VGEAGRQRLNRFLLRLLPKALVTGEDGVDRRDQRRFERGREPQTFADPLLQLAAGLRQRVGGRRRFFRPHGIRKSTSTNGVPDCPHPKSIFARSFDGRPSRLHRCEPDAAAITVELRYRFTFFPIFSIASPTLRRLLPTDSRTWPAASSASPSL